MATAQSREAVLSTVALVTSVTTLVCCALPAALVAIGAGAVVAGMVSAAPQLVALSENKVAVFGVAGAVLAISAAFRFANRHAPCPADPARARACNLLRKIAGMALAVSVACYIVGFVFAFIL